MKPLTLVTLLSLSSLSFSGAAFAEAAAPGPDEARGVAMQLLKTLSGRLAEAMGSAGPGGAVNVCTDIAPAIAGELSRENGWRVTRVSSRPRNPMLGTADVWEQGVLEEFEARNAKGEDYAKMEFHAVVEEPDGRYLRYMKAIGTAPLCLTCHGSKAQIIPDVASRLEQNYPHDPARDYAAGDLRGAVSIKLPLD